MIKIQNKNLSSFHSKLALAIETSCDESAIALLEVKDLKSINPSFRILTSKVSSQIKIHRKFGGVVPSLASREHVKNLPIVLKEVLKEKDNKNIDLIFVTQGPGLIPALLIGVNFARAISYRYQLPVYPVNHLWGHLYSALIDAKKIGQWQNLKEIDFPVICLVVSGGHTNLALMEDLKNYEVLGETLDDASGEAFDKVGRLLGLVYPAGAYLEKLAQNGQDIFNFPRPMINSKDFNFSFAGLKTAVLYKLRDLGKKAENSKIKANVAASFQKAAIDVLVKKTIKAREKFRAKTILIGGGVANNQILRKTMIKEANGIRVLMPDKELTTDNALMIALAGFLRVKYGLRPISWQKLDAKANLSL